MEKLPKAIITDLDGTLVNIMDEVLSILYLQLGVTLTPEHCVEYNVAESFWDGCTDIRRTFSHNYAFDTYLTRNCWENPALYEQAKPYWDWHEALITAKRAGISVLLLTSRPRIPAVVNATELWCNRWGYSTNSLIFSNSLDRGKLQVLQGMHALPCWFVDDDMSINREAKLHGLDVVIKPPKRPWTHTKNIKAPETELLHLLGR